MGCFNLTCSVSHLPITDQLPIRAFLLARTETPCEYNFYPSTFFVPLSTAIEGKYDDYGRIDKVKPSPNFDLAAAHFLPHLGGKHQELYDSSTSEKGKFKYYSKTINFDTRVAFVREDVYQEVLKTQGGAPDRAVIEKELKDLKKAYDEEKEMNARFGGGRAPSLFGYFMMGTGGWGMLTGLFRGGEGDYLETVLEPYRRKLCDMFDKKAEVDAETVDFGMEMATHLRFHRALHYLCILWQPTTNMVGQETPFDLQRDFNKAINRICDKEIKHRKELDAEWDDEPISPVKKKKAPKAKPSPKAK